MKNGYLRARYFCVVGLVLCVVIGCGSKFKPLGGKVTFEDGKPLHCGYVVFVNGGFQSTGDIQADGTYTVGTLDMKDGIPPGDYQVYITGAGETKDSGGYTSFINKKFESTETSGLTCKVPVDGNTFDIKVTPPQK
ncbi:MAG: hypothetical protein ACRC46_09365 [Thermoguttaceae bacterium]